MADRKKYYQTRKDREDESRAMRRKGEMDSRYFDMLSEDHSAPANLPQHVVHEYYPKCTFMDAYELDDTIRGLDETRKDDVDKIERYHSDSKY